MTAVPQALHSLNSGKHPDDRDQEVHTPSPVLDPIHRVFGGQIVLDPCAASNPAHWFARFNLCLETSGVDGLTVPWVNGTYWNPPYNKQGQWMAKARREYLERGTQSIGLGKAQTHRVYFWPGLRGGCEVIWLKPIYFLNRDHQPITDGAGRKAAAGFGVALFCWGVSLPAPDAPGGLGKLELHREVVR